MIERPDTGSKPFLFFTFTNSITNSKYIYGIVHTNGMTNSHSQKTTLKTTNFVLTEERRFLVIEALKGERRTYLSMMREASRTGDIMAVDGHEQMVRKYDALIIYFIEKENAA